MNQFQIDLVVYKTLSPLLYLKHRKVNANAAGSILYLQSVVVFHLICHILLVLNCGNEWQ